MQRQPKNDTSYQIGNKKLGSNIAYLNLGPAILCPSHALGLCQLKNPDKECYSLKAERTYGSSVCTKARMAASEYWARNSAWQLAQDLVRLNEARRKKITVLRISESCDFQTQSDVDKAEMLAYYLSEHGIRTYCYTARRDLDYSDCEHLVVNGSGWMAHNRFQVAYKLTNPEPGKWLAEDKDGNQVECQYVCPGDCRKCSVCLSPRKRTTAVRLH